MEVRTNSRVAGFDKRALALLGGSFQDAGYHWGSVATYSLTYPKHLTQDGIKELREELTGKYDLVLALGSSAQKFFCNTSRTLDQFAGSLTWNSDVGCWVLPSYHPSVVYVGDKKTINARYDKFDVLYDHIQRAAALVNGEREYPHPEGLKVDWEFIGHDGIEFDGKRYSGYYEADDDEVDRAEEVFTEWLNLLDRARTGALTGFEETVSFAIDTESRNTNVFRDQAFLMLQVYDGRKAYAFNAGVVQHPRVQPLVKLFLGHGAARFDLWNTKYDRQVLWHEYRVSLEDRDIDGMVLSMGITEKGRQCGLKYRSRQDLNAPFYEEGLEKYVDKNDVDYSCIPPRILAEYGCMDVYCTYEEIPILEKRVEQEGTNKLIPFLMDAQRVLGDIEYQGLDVDIEYAKRTSALWEPKIQDAIRKVQDYARDVGFPAADSGIGASYKEVCECVPESARRNLEGARVLSYAKLLREQKIVLPSCEQCSDKRYVSRLDVTLNVNSSTQMQHLCFDILKMKELTYEPRSTCKDFWKFNGNHPLAILVAEYKELQYLRRNFLEGIQRFVTEDGKVHPDFLLFGTKTGRLAIHSPAAQTIPQHGENAKVAKKLIIAPEGYVVLNGDYKSLEMFIAHHLTGDEKLLENLTGEWDIHTALAAQVYNKDPGDVDPEERQSVKSVNFGAGYNISGFKLALDPAMEKATGEDPDKAQEFLDVFWGMYSTWHDHTVMWKEQALTEFHLTTEMGRKRRWNLVTADNRKKVQNQAVNFPGQSLASDLCLSSLIKLNPMLQELDYGRVILTVHDALVFYIRKERVHEAVALIEKEMTTPPFETTTPFAVDFEVGPNYGEKQPYDPQKDYSVQ